MHPEVIDDGANALDDSDPRSAKYILYRSFDYDAEGKNVINPSKPVWPIRWKNLSQTPGKNGYLGDYVAEPAERAQYKPVYISQEDFFCIYKDTDVKRNPEYQVNSGYPLGIEIEQTTYSWGFDGHKDLVFFVFNVKNKSGNVLNDCYLAPALDPDIGSATNDRCSFYFKDSTLNLAYQYTGTEAGYPGVLGFDFLESPKIKTPADSANFRAQTGRIRKVGEQIGLTTFRNWVMENDPSGANARYDFMAANVKDGDVGAGDKRMLFATGPFTMNAGDTARVVMCVMIAPGVGTAVPGQIESSTFLDSLVALDKYAQDIFENDRLSAFPLATVSANIIGNLSEVKVVVDGSRVNAKSVMGKLVTANNSSVGSGALFDDGNHNDGTAGDKVFGGTITVASQQTGLNLDVSITDNSNKTVEWRGLATNITTTKLQLNQSIVFSDNLNNNGLVNIGERFRFGIPITNSTSFNFSNLTITPLYQNSLFATMSVPLLNSNSQFTPVYNQNNAATYFEFLVPVNYSDGKLNFDVLVTDNNGNRWKDAISFDVYPFTQTKAVTSRLSGRATAIPNILITD